MKLSKAQQYKFWSLFKEAVQEALPADASKAEIDAFRYKLIEDATGKTSLTLVSKCKEYDLLMAATAFCTENDQEKLYWCTTSERRFLHLIGTGLTQIGQIAKEPHAWDYVKGILHQAHWPDTWKDISDEMLHTVFKMLDTHRRRLLWKNGWRGSKHGQPLGFTITRTYFHTVSGLHYRDDLPIKPATPAPQEALS
ncbi:MAG: hypothetical protein PF904_00230 [Kiritimatiellae bacterium]|jgi:hypothetical protein|nr:hypothetical protein [Kiritimatiellia bacterium]